MKIHPIRLELLRTGPAHNQLLSPLTSYLALCGNHDPETFHVPFEHHEILRLLHRVRHPGPPQRDALRRLAAGLYGMLAGLRSLTAEMAQPDAEMIELQLVIGCSELAILPFELLCYLDGIDVRERLCAQPLVITRLSRRKPGAHAGWPAHPRILVITSSAAGDVPQQQTLIQLRAALDPWLAYSRPGDGELERHVTLLPDASLRQIRQACERERFTHVHILAHGLPMRDPETGDLTGFGVALRADPDGTDLTDGARLAEALLPAAPHVVSLAVCDGGAEDNNILYPGAALAHVLHEHGIPMVVASQLPLSKSGALRMIVPLYRGLLSGADPRDVLEDARRALFIEQPLARPGGTDWISTVAYACWQERLEDELLPIRFVRTKRACDALLGGLELAERLDTALHPEGRPQIVVPAKEHCWPAHSLDRLHTTARALDELHHRLEKIREEAAPDRHRFAARDVSGYLGSVWKRFADLCASGHTRLLARSAADPEAAAAFRALPPEAQQEARRRALLTRDALRQSLRGYEAISRDTPRLRRPDYALQALAVRAFLGEPTPAAHIQEIQESLTIIQKHRLRTLPARVWIEATLLSGCSGARDAPDSPGDTTYSDELGQALDRALALALAHPDAASALSGFEGYSLRRQLWRYRTWVTPAPGRQARFTDTLERIEALLDRLRAPHHCDVTVDWHGNLFSPGHTR